MLCAVTPNVPSAARRLSRRGALAGVGAAALATLSGCFFSSSGDDDDDIDSSRKKKSKKSRK